MRDGLYKVQFHTARGDGAGVIYAQGGKFWGGDGTIYYVGTYIQADNVVSGMIKTNRHTQGLQAVTGVDRAEINVKGPSQGDSANLTGSVAQVPGLTFTVTLTRLSD